LGFFISGPGGFATTIAGAGAGLAFSNVVRGPGPQPPPNPQQPPPPQQVPVPPPNRDGGETIIINGSNNTLFKGGEKINIRGSFNNSGTVTGTVTSIPQPASFVLTVGGLLGLASLRAVRRRRLSDGV
jgi:hypothetical protein